MIVADRDLEAAHLIADYPGIRRALDQFCDQLEDLGMLRDALFRSERERLFSDHHDCRAAHTRYVLHVAIYQDRQAARQLVECAGYRAASAALYATWDARLDRRVAPLLIAITTED